MMVSHWLSWGGLERPVGNTNDFKRLNYRGYASSKYEGGIMCFRCRFDMATLFFKDRFEFLVDQVGDVFCELYPVHLGVVYPVVSSLSCLLLVV